VSARAKGLGRAGWVGRALVVGLVATAISLAPDAGELRAQSPLHNCDFCHSLHGGDFQALTDYATSEDVCLSCHGDAGPAQVDRDGQLVTVPRQSAIHDGSKHTTPTSCWDCHNHEAEAGNNWTMIQSSLPTPNSGTKTVVFTARTGTNSFADGDGTYDGVCEVCHTITSQHRNDGTAGKHNAATDCTQCHTHDSGFQGAGGGCTGCHSSSQGPRRPIVPEFSRTTHHVDWNAAGFASPDSIPDSDCTTCHDQSQHQQGSVRLWDVDQPGNTGASVVLTGDPNTILAEAAKVEAHCTSCHDSDGANGNTTPFSGGATVPALDLPAWAAASHEGTTAIAGCYGNGLIGCHSSGHGSEKKFILGPGDVAPTAPALEEEEEGFCLRCHDSSGPASSDIAAGFNQTILWAQNPAGTQSNPNLNDRHDVQYDAQSRSGAVIECVSCHNPHYDTPAQPHVTDPDPNDGRVPGTGQVDPELNFVSEFCEDCHDGSFGPNASGPSSAMTNIRSTYSGTDMYKPGGSTNKWNGQGPVECLDCHIPHASGNLFNTVKVVRQPNGDPVPSDGGAGYTLTTNASRDRTINGYDWCNTCHSNSMGLTGMNRDNCFKSGCHDHDKKW